MFLSSNLKFTPTLFVVEPPTLTDILEDHNFEHLPCASIIYSYDISPFFLCFLLSQVNPPPTHTHTCVPLGLIRLLKLNFFTIEQG